MIKKVLTISMGVFLLAGCSKSIESIDPLSLEEVAGSRLAQLTNDEKEGMIYQAVSDRITVDTTELIAMEDKELGGVNNLLDQVNAMLKGKKSDVIKEEYANYLLLEFARTPYEWKQTKVSPVGFDPASRLYFVDVEYSTTNELKRVVPDSKIPAGSDNEEVMKQNRYADYVDYLTARAEGGNYSSLLKDFEKRWGKVSAIKEEQQGVSLLARTASESQKSGGIGKLTYSGLVEDSKLNKGAKATFRYVFSYKYNLGEETDLQINALYLKDYTMNQPEETLESYTSSDTVGVEVLKPFIDKAINSYHKAVEESNDIGLYQLYKDYGSVDKYYADLSNYTYNKVDGYSYQVLERKGTNVVVKVDRVNKIRAKGSGMSLPTYNETLLYNLVLDKDDTIKIKSVNLVESKLIGEPMSVIENVTGISDIIKYSGESFTEDNKKAVEDTLKKFSNVVFQANVDSDEFGSTVDVGVSQSTLLKMSDTISSIKDANKKVNYIVSWNTKTNVYASVNLREIYQMDDSNLDTESVVELVNRDGEWKVVNYTRTISIKTSKAEVDTKNAISIDE